jgi:hypothetical protein
MQFAFAVAIYFVCALAALEGGGEELIDMEAFYWRNRRLFYAVLMVCMFISLIINAEFLKTPNTALFVQENATVLPMVVATSLPLTLQARWAQWVGGVGTDHPDRRLCLPVQQHPALTVQRNALRAISPHSFWA